MDIRPEDWERQSPDAFEENVKRLLQGILDYSGHTGLVTRGPTSVRDGGVDVTLQASPAMTAPGFEKLVPSAHVGYQCKVGGLTASKVEGEVLTSTGDVKHSIHEILSAGGHYILVVGTFLTTALATDRLDKLQEHLSDYPADHVHVVGSETLAAACHSLPYMAGHLNKLTSLHFCSFTDWSRQAAISSPPDFVASDESDQLISVICDFLKSDPGPNFLTLRGASGRGKSRLMHEAITRSNSGLPTIYVHVPERYLAGQHAETLFTRPTSKGILVLDNMSQDQVKEVMEKAPMLPGMKFVSLTREPGHSTTGVELEWNGCDAEQCAQIVSSQVDDLDPSIASWCGKAVAGIPLLALQLGRRIAEDDGKSHSDWFGFQESELFQELMPEGAPPDSKYKLLVGYLALLGKLGIRGDPGNELNAICEITSLDVGLAREYLKELQTHGLLDGQHYVELRPLVLRVHLLQKFFAVHCPSITEFTALLDALNSKLPGTQISERIFGSLAYVGSIPEGRTILSSLLGPSGLFQDLQGLEENAGRFRFMHLAEADPELAIGCIERIFAGATAEELRDNLKLGRFEVVQALDRIAVWQATFDRAARCLAQLAVSENQDYSNNAEGIFKGLFAAGIGPIAPSETPPSARLPILKNLLDSGEDEKIGLAIQALGKALETYMMRAVGSEYQAGYAPAKGWMPETWAPVFEYVREVLSLLRSHGETTTFGSEAALKVICSNSRGLINRYKDLRGSVLEMLEVMLARPDSVGQEALGALLTIHRYDKDGLDAEHQELLDKVDHDTKHGTTTMRFRRFVGMYSTSDHDMGYDDDSEMASALDNLASELLADSDLLTGLLENYATDMGRCGWFLHRLGALDGGHAAAEIVKGWVGDDPSRIVNCLRNYLIGLLRNGGVDALATWNDIKSEGTYTTCAVQAKVALLADDADAIEVCALIDAHPEAVDPNLHIPAKDYSAESISSIARALVDAPRDEAKAAGLEFVSHYGVEKTAITKLDPENAIHVLAESTGILATSSRTTGQNMAHWHWGQLAKALVKHSESSADSVLDILHGYLKTVEERNSFRREISAVIEEVARLHPATLQQKIDQLMDDDPESCAKFIIDTSSAQTLYGDKAWWQYLDEDWVLNLLKKVPESHRSTVITVIRLDLPPTDSSEPNLAVKVYEEFADDPGIDSTIFNSTSRGGTVSSMSQAEAERAEYFRQLASTFTEYKISKWFSRESAHCTELSQKFAEREEAGTL